MRYAYGLRARILQNATNNLDIDSLPGDQHKNQSNLTVTMQVWMLPNEKKLCDQITFYIACLACLKTPWEGSGTQMES